MPTPVRIATVVNPLLADLRGEQRTETVPPEPYRFVADINAAFEQDVLDLRSDSGYRMYSITASRIISGDELK
jgi:hypothetical protein